MDNVDKFNKITLALFAKLYGNFPKRYKYISYADFCLEFDFEECQEIFTASLEFLEYEGFIRYSSSTKDGSFANIGLTLKGLSALQKTPKPIDERSDTIGRSLIKRINENSWQVATNLLSQILESKI